MTSSLTPPPPEAISAYLRNAGWRESNGETRLPVQFWSRPDDATQEVMVPLSVEGADFELRWGELVAILAKNERRSPDAVQTDLALARFDVFEIAARSPDSDLSVSLDEGVQLVSAAKSLVVGAACSTLQRKPYHGRSQPNQARAQSRTIRMGQTRRGSYVIPIISPVSDVDESGVDRANRDVDSLLPDLDREMFPRRAMVTLVDSLSSVHRLTIEPQSEPSNAELVEAVGRDGVSSDVCEAVSMMLKADRSEIAFAVRWALTTQRPNVRSSDALIFPYEASDRVTRLASRLKDTAETGRQVIYGSVTNLSRGASDPTGEVTVQATFGGHVRRVLVTLADEQYHVASQANDARRPVVAAGTLERLPGRTYRMIDVTQFEPQFESDDEVALASPSHSY